MGWFEKKMIKIPFFLTEMLHVPVTAPFFLTCSIWRIFIHVISWRGKGTFIHPCLPTPPKVRAIFDLHLKNWKIFLILRKNSLRKKFITARLGLYFGGPFKNVKLRCPWGSPRPCQHLQKCGQYLTYIWRTGRFFSFSEKIAFEKNS